MIEINKICVIGGTGFVGSHVVKQALEKGWKVNVTTRDPKNETKLAFLKKLPKSENISFFYGELDKQGSFDEAIQGCDGVVVCALPESPSNEALIETVRGGVGHILASCSKNGVKSVVITSSGGSTNPKEGDPELKNELEHWSDPDFQISKGKFSPAAKTLMEKLALKFAEDNANIKVAIMNPNLIMGPSLYTEMPTSGSLVFLRKILKRESFQKIPNGSMSIIDVRDLASMEIKSLESPNIKGRYFCVLKSFHYKDHMKAINKARPSFQIPELGYDGDDVRPTQFDMTRRDSIGIKLRDLDQIYSGAIECLVGFGQI